MCRRKVLTFTGPHKIFTYANEQNMKQKNPYVH